MKPFHVAVFVDEAGVYAREVLRGIARHQRELPLPWSLHVVQRRPLELPPLCLKTWGRQGHGVIARVDSPEVETALAASGLPVVSVSGALESPKFPTFMQDACQAARMAANFFRERGFQHFAFVGLEFMRWSVERGQWFQDHLGSHDLTCASLAFTQEEMRADRIRQSIAVWLRKLPQPLALWACNDEMALHVVSACLREGIEVPEQVAVLGMDDDAILCEASTPPLSSLANSGEKAGYRAARRLHRLMSGLPDDETHVVSLPPRGIVQRGSTDVHAVDDPHVALALQIIESEACSGIKVADVAARVPAARRVLERRFRALMQRSLLQEIWRVQCTHAMRLLETSKLPMIDVAERCGYEHVEHFSTVFKKTTGLSPGAYRKQAAPVKQTANRVAFI